jgi:hypothetical protein
LILLDSLFFLEKKLISLFISSLLVLQEFPDSRMARPLVNIYEQEDYSKDDLVSTVERCMKKYADTLMRSLDGITGRLSQLEIHFYKLERSIGEIRGDMVQGQNEADLKFKSLEKHMQEVTTGIIKCKMSNYIFNFFA